jgi:L-lactate dehydrogenase complex protein LldE
VRVSLFATCLADQFFAEACADAVRLLRHVGAEVSFPEAQTCCGQPAFNAGSLREARRMATHTLDVFEDAEYVVLPSGSCTAMVGHRFEALLEAPDRERAAELAGRSYELSRFLVEVAGVDRLGSGLTGRRVAYHHGCHALRELGIEREPVHLLEGCGAEIVAWEADRECCGFGGLFSTKLPELSAGMANRKLDTLPPVDVVTSTDGGCLLQLRGRADRRGAGPSFQLLSSLLWEGVGA